MFQFSRRDFPVQVSKQVLRCKSSNDVIKFMHEILFILHLTLLLMIKLRLSRSEVYAENNIQCLCILGLEESLSKSLSKTEWLVVNNDANFKVLINQEASLRQKVCFEYLGSPVTKWPRGDQIKEAARTSLEGFSFGSPIAAKTKTRGKTQVE